ncbi:MAG: bifunctional (p)ppGpp synthetase/guanosine-3',5'-bis(diphosphate) 3'-pyrophosphohydrolase [Bacteroidales bacterium]|nr:bifunctional (p)ppGpp synthetase/guanosine-3',5'-bis(diphosphate) 3'-pyrophosphohydrolase [Bacteroidales bacterium]MBN2821106.1 bifunctional (p)ppGpp synthetase/guanosine-3',5'-bis(diphosphate) 3'-pyrophosphohydrolase [Bacteroidales bacterium]
MEVSQEIGEAQINQQFEEMLSGCARCTDEGKVMIRKAFKVAYDAHKGMLRKSGEPYIIHPLSVAKIVSHDLGLGAKSITCSLLHDVVEDTDYTLEDIERLFGEKIASIIDGLTKISGAFDNKSSLQAENFRKMLLTLSDDVRVILIKIADRLHNMRTLHSMPPHKQMKISSETIYLYAPLAHRLGLYSIKTELEDLSLKYRYPKIYEELSQKLKQNEHERQAFMEEFKRPIEERLKSYGLKYEIEGRHKSIYSIWQKMQNKNVPFEEVFDLLAIRIVFDPDDRLPEKTQCWNIYSLITDIYMPKPERIRDWVSTPKANGYEALHATVMGPKGTWVEVQIRSRRMDEIAERGFAAHWKYKQTTDQESELDKWLKQIRELLEDPNSDALEFLDDFKLNLFASEIMIFTPKGEIKTLPANANALDFAYHIHSEIGHKAIGAKINHKLVSLHHLLKSGDQVEIISSDKAQSRIEWMNKVNTAKAKSAIKAYLKGETKNRIEKGKQILDQKLEAIKLKPSNRIFRKLLPNYEVASKDELYSKIAIGIISLDDLKKVLKKNTKNKWIRYWSLQFKADKDSQQELDELDEQESTPKKKKEPVYLRESTESNELNYTIASCCHPIPGDEVIGFKDDYNQIIIHKNKCNEAVKLSSSYGDRIVDVLWTTHKIYSFLIKISLSGSDRFGMYNDITTVITKQLNVNMRNINLESHDGIWEGTIELYVHNTKDLNNLIMNLGKVKGVNSVKRVEKIKT